MKYQYNYGFLQEWLDANPTIQKGAVQQALGVKSNNGLNSWIRKEGPMSVISILRFCNSFQVPLSAFFRDMDAGENAAVVPGLPTVNDQLEPDGGYATDATSRRQGERTLLDPLDVTVTHSVVPGVVVAAERNNDVEEDDVDDAPCNGEGLCQNIIVGNISDANLAAIIELENKHSEQRNKLLDIIEEQRKQIADLTTLVGQQRRNAGYQASYGMVGEDTE